MYLILQFLIINLIDSILSSVQKQKNQENKSQEKEKEMINGL